MTFSTRELSLLFTLFNETLEACAKDAAEERQMQKKRLDAMRDEAAHTMQNISEKALDKMGAAMMGELEQDASASEPRNIDGTDFKLSDLLTELECRFRCTSFEHCFYCVWKWGIELEGNLSPQEAAQQLLYYTAKQFRKLYLAGARQIIWRNDHPRMELKLHLGGHRLPDLVKLYARFIALGADGVPCVMPDICPDGGAPTLLDLREFMAELNVPKRAPR